MPLFRRSLFAVLLLVLTASGCAGTASVETSPVRAATAQDVPAPPPVPTPPKRVAAADEPRNVILFIADGNGPANMAMARGYAKAVLGRAQLTLDPLLVGNVGTSATDSRVTDSASGATAYATGHKTYNGAISVDTLGRPLATLLEGAEARGMATGLVATSRITHATPASFAAHVPQRAQEADVAEQMLTKGVEVILGGGRIHFLPEADGGSRSDGRDLLAAARAGGYHVALTPEALADAPADVPLLALLTPNHLPFEIDRDTLTARGEALPTVAELTTIALERLRGAEQGFFLVVEASRIDHSAHGNDAATTLHEILAYDDAVAAALQFAQADGNTLVVATSDHETGGLSLGRRVDGRSPYAWHPEVLARQRTSLGPMGEALAAGRTPAEVLATYAGLEELTDGDRAVLARAEEEGTPMGYALLEVISRHALLGWTTSGHTAVDVGIYAFGPGSERFRGFHENDAVGRMLAELMGLDLDALTETMRSSGGM